MENASKALLMAAEVLISVVIVSSLLLLFNNLNSYQATERENESEAEVRQFNAIYESYNRNDVRGNDLYSLLNRVVDYNKRKSKEGTDLYDEGQFYNYSPITVIVYLKSDKAKASGDVHDQKDFIAPYTEKNMIFSDTTNEYTINSTKNELKELLEREYKFDGDQHYPQNTLMNLVNGFTNIFIGKNDTEAISKGDKEKQKAVYSFNSAFGSEILKNDSLDQNIRDMYKHLENVQTFYEYIQFTRAHFDCINFEYNNATGRVSKMEFKYNGTIN